MASVGSPVNKRKHNTEEERLKELITNQIDELGNDSTIAQEKKLRKFIDFLNHDKLKIYTSQGINIKGMALLIIVKHLLPLTHNLATEPKDAQTEFYANTAKTLINEEDTDLTFTTSEGDNTLLVLMTEESLLPLLKQMLLKLKKQKKVKQMLLSDIAHAPSGYNAITSAIYAGNEAIASTLISYIPAESREQLIAAWLNANTEINVKRLSYALKNNWFHDDDKSKYGLLAASRGYTNILALFLDPAIKMTSAGFKTNALAAAARYGHTATVDFLFNNGINLDSHRGHITRAFYHAASNRHIDTVTLLLDKGANINYKHHSGHNAFSIASRNRDFATLNLLIARNVDTTFSFVKAFNDAASRSDDELMTFLLNQVSNDFLTKNIDKLLTILAAYNNLPFLSLLLEKNPIPKYILQPFLVAATLNRTDIVKLLFEKYRSSLKEHLNLALASAATGGNAYDKKLRPKYIHYIILKNPTTDESIATLDFLIAAGANDAVTAFKEAGKHKLTPIQQFLFSKFSKEIQSSGTCIITSQRVNQIAPPAPGLIPPSIFGTQLPSYHPAAASTGLRSMLPTFNQQFASTGSSARPNGLIPASIFGHQFPSSPLVAAPTGFRSVLPTFNQQFASNGASNMPNGLIPPSIFGHQFPSSQPAAASAGFRSVLPSFNQQFASNGSSNMPNGLIPPSIFGRQFPSSQPVAAPDLINQVPDVNMQPADALASEARKRPRHQFEQPLVPSAAPAALINTVPDVNMQPADDLESEARKKPRNK